MEEKTVNAAYVGGIPSREYYYPELDLNSNAEKLYIQARNGYIEDVEALKKVSEILDGEKMTYEKLTVDALIEYHSNLDKDGEPNTLACVYASAKVDICSQMAKGDVELKIAGNTVTEFNLTEELHFEASHYDKQGDNNDAYVYALCLMTSSDADGEYKKQITNSYPLNDFIRKPVSDLVRDHNEALFYTQPERF